MKRKGLTLLLLLIMMNILIACNKDDILDRYDQVIRTFGKSTLTNERSLIGKKTSGSDEYTGQYQAEYKHFTGREYLFGGTTINRKLGNQIKVTCVIQKEAGLIEIGILSGPNEKNILSQENGRYRQTIELTQGANYLYIKGQNFSGRVAVRAR